MSDWDSPEAIARRAKYGQPETFRSRVDALRLVGRPELSPDGVHAFLYRSREAAEEYARVNARQNNVPSLGIVETAAGWVGVLDLRPALAAAKRRAG